jgi:hypothetical protein
MKTFAISILLATLSFTAIVRSENPIARSLIPTQIQSQVIPAVVRFYSLSAGPFALKTLEKGSHWLLKCLKCIIHQSLIETIKILFPEIKFKRGSLPIAKRARKDLSCLSC